MLVLVDVVDIVTVVEDGAGLEATAAAAMLICLSDYFSSKELRMDGGENDQQHRNDLIRFAASVTHFKHSRTSYALSCNK